MNRSSEHPEWTDRLSDFLDGELEADDHTAVESHLAECGSCRRTLEELRRVRDRAAALGPVEPDRDLWAGIAATIDAPPTERPAGTRIIELPTAERQRREIEKAVPPRRFSLSSRQLAAASVALIAASSLVTWALRPAPNVTSVPSTSAAGVIAPVSQVAGPPEDLAAELASLEETVSRARGTLDPNTVRVLERNLGIIEQAIADSQRALAQDPENDFLAEHLQRVYQRKVEYLRDAARAAERAG